MPPLPADFIHARACKLKCEKILTRPVVLFRGRGRTGRRGYAYSGRGRYTGSRRRRG